MNNLKQNAKTVNAILKHLKKQVKFFKKNGKLTNEELQNDMHSVGFLIAIYSEMAK